MIPGFSQARTLGWN